MSNDSYVDDLLDLTANDLPNIDDYVEGLDRFDDLPADVIEAIREYSGEEVKEDIPRDLIPDVAPSDVIPDELYLIAHRAFLRDIEPLSRAAHRRFEVRSNQLFLTYPQCPISKEIALQLLTDRFDYYGAHFEEYVVAHEKHKNGDDHLHVYLKLRSSTELEGFRFSVYYPQFANLPWGNRWYQGNYQGCRSSKNVTKYCTKSDDYLANFDVSSKLASLQGHRKFIGNLLLTQPLHSLIEKHPELLFDYAKLKANVDAYKMDILPATPEIPVMIPNNFGCIMLYNRDQKRRHYWIYSTQPNRGKTTFGLSLEKDLSASFVGGDRGFFDVKANSRILIFDEFTTPRFTCTQLNQMCDGTFSYAYFKQGNVKLEEKKPLIVVLSNAPIDQVYPNKSLIVKARFIELCVDTFPPIFL